LSFPFGRLRRSGGRHNRHVKNQVGQGCQAARKLTSPVRAVPCPVQVGRAFFAKTPARNRITLVCPNTTRVSETTLRALPPEIRIISKRIASAYGLAVDAAPTD
jgi:hypothetical protein